VVGQMRPRAPWPLRALIRPHQAANARRAETAEAVTNNMLNIAQTTGLSLPL